MTTNTARAIVEKAFSDAMKLSRGGALSTAQLDDGLARLQDIVNVEAVLGLKLFLEREVSLTLTAAKQMYSFYPSGDIVMTRPLRIKDATYVSSSAQARPLIPMSRSDWNAFPNRSASGAVNQYYPERLYDRLNLYLWQVPDTAAAAGTVRVTVHVAAATLALDATTAFPPEWVMYLRWALAADLSSGMPVEVIQRAEGKAAQYRQILENFDVEDAPTRLQPTYPQYNYSEFNS